MSLEKQSETNETLRFCYASGSYEIRMDLLIKLKNGYRSKEFSIGFFLKILFFFKLGIIIDRSL